MTSTNSLTAAAEWFRGQAGAILVLVVRGEDAGKERAPDLACALDPLVSPGDAVSMIEAAMSEVVPKINADRLEKKARKRTKEMGAA